MRTLIRKLWIAARIAAAVAYGGTFVLAVLVDSTIAFAMAIPATIITINRLLAAFGVTARAEARHYGYSAAAYAFATDADGSFDHARAMIYDS